MARRLQRPVWIIVRSVAPIGKKYMFFKRKVSVNEYLTTRLDLLLSPEQAELWLEFKRSCGNDEIVSLRDDIYLTHLRAAHLRLLSMVLTKKYFRNEEIMFSIETFIEDYLDERDDGMIKHFVDLYGPALGSWPDGVLVMARAMMEHFSLFYEPETLFAFQEMFYGAIAGFRADFKKVKLFVAGEPD